MRRRAPVELRRLRLAGAATGVRHQRLRRDTARDRSSGTSSGWRRASWWPAGTTGSRGRNAAARADRRTELPRSHARVRGAADPRRSGTRASTSRTRPRSTRPGCRRPSASGARPGSRPPPVAKAYTRDNLQAIGKLTTVVYGRRRIVSDPPLVVPLEEPRGRRHRRAARSVAGARHELSRHAARTIGGTCSTTSARPTSRTRWSVSAASAPGRGSCCWSRPSQDDALLLQAKQAAASVLGRVRRRSSEYVNQGERVVAGQRLMQAASDIFLGWLRAEAADGRDTDYYVRQLRDWKLSVDIDNMNPDGMALYARALRLDAGPRPRPFRRPLRDRGVPGQVGPLRPCRRRLRRDLRRPERPRPRRPRRRRHLRPRASPARRLTQYCEL